LFNHLVSFCRTLAKFEAKRDANTLLLHDHHLNEKKKKIRKTAQTRRYKNAQIQRMRALSTKPCRTLLHKGYMQRYQAPLVRTKTGSFATFKFREFLGSTSYVHPIFTFKLHKLWHKTYFQCAEVFCWQCVFV
jgi:hypothetical protein